MSFYRVIGIDPALTNVGLCVLESGGPDDYRVTNSLNVRPSTKLSMVERLAVIQQQTRDFVLQDVQAFVVEDPTGQVRVKTKWNSPRTIAVMSLAVGVVMSVVIDRGLSIGFVDTDDWMPKQKSGNLEHIMAKQYMVRYLMGRIKFPAGVSEHVVMAAGVARWWIEQRRMKAAMAVSA